jgi:L-asparaginase
LPHTNITVITTGGTIAMKADTHEGAKPILSGSDLIHNIKFEQEISVDILNFSNLPGAHLSLNDIFNLSEQIKKLFNERKADGVVITHGTDTLEETAYVLDLLHKTDHPVIVTGAMRNASQYGYDGTANLYNSILAAGYRESRGMGVLVSLNNELHLAKDATKVNATQLNAFHSPVFGPVGIIYGKRIRYFRYPITREFIPVSQISAEVEILKFCLGSSDYLLKSINNSTIDGIVIEATGVGHVSPIFAAAIKELINNGKVVLLSTRCPENIVLENVYGFDGSESHLTKMGVILASGMTSQKARIKLILALSFTKDIKEINKYFSLNDRI